MDHTFVERQFYSPIRKDVSKGKGKGIVILHAGSGESGFIEDCELIFLGIHDENGDYQCEMNTVIKL